MYTVSLELDADSGEITPLEIDVPQDRDPTRKNEKIQEKNYASFVAANTCMCISVSLVLCLLMAAFGVLKFGLSDPLGGQFIRDTEEAEQNHAFQVAVQSLSEPGEETFKPQQTELVDDLNLYYIAGKNHEDDVERTLNVLTVENVQKMAALEDAILNDHAYKNVCYRLAGQKQCAPPQRHSRLPRRLPA